VVEVLVSGQAGAALSAPKRKAEQSRKLHRGHFAFMRALAQGLDERASWDRYLRLEGEHTDLRTVRSTIAWIRDEFAAATGRPVTFGWGPRFLHSTGQFHKGGPAIGVFLQVTAASTEDLAIPERPFTFGELISAQAAGDAQVLEEHGRPVLRLHLTNRAAGVAQLQDIVSALSARASATES